MSITVKQVTKRFGDFVALDNLNLEVPSGSLLALLGLYYYAWNGLAPLGGVLVGYMCDHGGTQLAFFVGGGSALGVTALGVAAVKRPPHTVPARSRAEPAAERLAA